MKNELLLLGSVILIYGTVLVAYRLFRKNGLYVMTAIATILANIEVLLLVDGFGMEQTLGNVMFASTYLITDILSENEGKKEATKAVWLGVFTSVVMLLFTQYWMLYEPASTDWASEHIRAIFSTTPRLLLASFLGYIVSQRFDVWLYHKLWDYTTKKTGERKGFLWLRNNLATLISQIVNTVIFTTVAFAGWYDTKTLLSVMMSSYVVYIFTSLLDTPAVYLARWMKRNGKIRES
ncbi:MAG: queuosine precursor transporter [Lachnospiraceae bacterium]|nr:queuosine precursor transporter [Lachnospiraceae bacterium]